LLFAEVRKTVIVDFFEASSKNRSKLMIPSTAPMEAEPGGHAIADQTVNDSGNKTTNLPKFAPACIRGINKPVKYNPAII